MSTLGIVALVVGILLGVVLIWAAIAIPAFRVVKRRAAKVRHALEEDLGQPARRVANAQGLGLESAGAAQLRGNGWLALTDDALVFRQWVPERQTLIPLATITSVGTERWWLGESVGSKLLCVRWRTSEGEGDAMAWRLRDLDGWLADLRDR